MAVRENTITRADFILKNAHLFWHIPESEKSQISDKVLVEFILNYGNTDDVKLLFDVLGIEHVADIFHQLASQKRVNLFPPVVHYFKKYFAKHVH